MKTICAIGAAIGLLAGVPALASAPQGREAVSVSVRTDDINFADPADLAKVRARLDRAVAAACNPGDRIGADVTPDWQCRREMARNAEPTIQQLAQRAGATARISLN